ncbi:MAG: (2Fe-2S) ferredoxin domain-containing protein [Cyanobacteriota bacterium]|nr:(2Fe-2S) ferredoxin domain-containing protein [Cyanobacteriota bacterium]
MLDTVSVLVCQGRCCRQQGSRQVLATFRELADHRLQIEASGCLGQCGHGPMVLIGSEPIWYERVQPVEIPFLIRQQVEAGIPACPMIYRRMHPQLC